MEELKVLKQDLTADQYSALNDIAVKTPDWNAKSEEFKIGVIMGIKARVD